jgi:2-(1,2-epoxy-1,2-dihydrophenyl)acetyl-CoA isomerase
MGKRISAPDAASWGMINRSVPAEDLDTAVAAYTDYYRQAPTKAIALMKKMLNKSFHSNLDTMLEYEAQCQKIAGSSADYSEGVMAFNEKRKPVFTGR